MKRIFTSLIVLLALSRTQAQCDVLGEGFAAGTTAPIGWAFTSIGGTYTTTGNYGLASPSIQYNGTNDRVVTAVFSGAFSFSFWIKGQGTDANSALLVEKSVDGIAFTIVENIIPMPTVGTTKSYNITPTITVLRFTYTKSVGNLAFDDVCIKSVPLSVDFTKLNLKTSINSNIISWQTATEKNNAQFQIERSQSGENFSKIGEVKGKGTSNVEQNYSFTDASPLNGINYYRLRQVDFDGTESVSKTVSVNFDAKGQSKVKAFPSPTHDFVNVELSGEGKTEISVRDMTGRVVMTQNTEGVSFTTLNLATLSNGLYIMSVRSNEVTESLKIQKY